MSGINDALLRYLGQCLTSGEETAEWRVGREFASYDAAERARFVHDVITVFNTGDPERHVALRLRALMDAADTMDSR